jgi:hypothetical protein
VVGVPSTVHATVESLAKPVPVMVTARSPWPAVAVDTDRLVIAGAVFRADTA